MAQTIVLRRSAQPGKIPDTGSLNLGELAINTYDGKIFFAKSGSIQSIEQIVTTNTITSGSINIVGTGSFDELVVAKDVQVNNSLYVVSDIVGNGDLDVLGSVSGSELRITGTGSFESLQVNDTLIVNHGTTIISGSQLVTSDLTVLGQVNARQFNISIISSSVLYESGSSNFGNSLDDTHTFTGSLQITGSVTASYFVGDGSGLTNLSVDLSTAQLNDVDGNDIPKRSFAELFLACATSTAIEVDLDFNI
jgi:hypothetical protein